MENLHKSVMIKEIISFLPLTKSINVIDATFGGGGYSKTILEKLNVNHLLAIDRDPISKIFAKEIESKFSNFTLINDKFSRIEEIVNNTKFKDKKFDIILFDLGTSSNQIDIPQSMIISEANNLRNNAAQQMGFDISKLEEDQFPIDNFKENALKRVRLGVLINKLIEENNISVDNDTLKKEIEDKSKSFKDPEQYVNWIYGNEEQLKNIESLVLEDKVAEYLEGKSKVEEESLSFEEVVSMG